MSVLAKLKTAVDALESGQAPRSLTDEQGCAKALRVELLAETDYLALNDSSPMAPEVATLRQQLRDFPATEGFNEDPLKSLLVLIEGQ